MSKALKHLKKLEWSMGKGQCPDCEGVPPRWHGHPLYLTADRIGHKWGCPMAQALTDLGEIPTMCGEYKSNNVYETYIKQSGILSTRLVAQREVTGSVNDFISVSEAGRLGIERLRMPIWASPEAHIKIDIIDGFVGAWIYLFDPLNLGCIGKDPVSYTIDPTERPIKCWVKYDGPLPKSAAYKKAQEKYAGWFTGSGHD